MNKPRLKEVTGLEPEVIDRPMSEISLFCRSSTYNLRIPLLSHNPRNYHLKGIIFIISPCCHRLSTNIKISSATFLSMALTRTALFCHCSSPICKSLLPSLYSLYVDCSKNFLPQTIWGTHPVHSESLNIE